MPSISVESGAEEGAAYGFPPGDVVFIVGRAPNSGIVISDPLVSRQHCRIERINGRYRVVDLGSHNGTYLNDQRMDKNSTREISFGDAIRIGETEMVLREEAPDDEGELAGRRLGGYQLVKRIGSGGMGEVYRAVQVALNRQVAIKILSPELTEDRSFVERFMTEARAAGRLNHPNVCQVHEVGETDGIYYYSMEYLPGGSVQERIRGGRSLPVNESVNLILGAARALDYAEKHGVIHCDIKPDNLMLTEDGEVRLTDLGIARTVKKMADKVKQEGGVLGSPHYMAPEQARGEPIDHRVDIYALGATFYRIIAGRTPFNGKNAREIMEKQVYEEPAGLRSVNPKIPQSVCRVINRMMKKKPEKRYQTARELIADLESLRDELNPPEAPEEIAARQSRTMRRARKRSGSTVYAALAAAVVLIAGGALYVAASGSGGDGKSLELMMARAQAAEGRGELEVARDIYRNVMNLAPAGSPLGGRAAREVERLERQMAGDSAREAVLRDWRVLEEMKAKAGSAEALRKLADAYRDFSLKHHNAPEAAAAKVEAREALKKYEAAAAEQVSRFEKAAAKLAENCKYGELRARWDNLASKFPKTAAADTASKRAEEAALMPARDLAAAEAAARKALEEGKLDDVLKPLERMRETDIGQLKTRVLTLIKEYGDKVAEARKNIVDLEARKRKLAACDKLRDEAVKLAKDYEYAAARAKFVEAQLAYRREGFEERAAATTELADGYWSERVLWVRLYDFGLDGGLATAMVKLADGKTAQVKRVAPAGLTCARGISGEETVPWKDLPLGSVYDLLRRPKLSVDDRVILARFALNRGLKAEAKEQLKKVLNADPERRDALAPLLKAAEGEGTP